MDKLRRNATCDSKAEYLNEMFDKFDKTLRVDDFIRRYTPKPISRIRVSQADIDKAFEQLGKVTEEERAFDCGACGVDTCTEMATLIAKGINTPVNCIEKEHKTVKAEHDALKENVVQFDAILTDTKTIKTLTADMVSSVGDINTALTAYNRMVGEIEKIAMQINIISLNASIEAAKAGVHGRSFSVVAEEIRRLAQSSNNSAKQTKEASKASNDAIVTVNELIESISKNVSVSYDNISEVVNSIRELLAEDYRNEETEDDFMAMVEGE
jgi:methyl-accepting chemotaxis protein